MTLHERLGRYGIPGLKRMAEGFRDGKWNSSGGKSPAIGLSHVALAKSSQNVSWISWTPRDIGLFLKGARTDAKLDHLLAEADMAYPDLCGAREERQRSRAAAFDRLYAEDDGDPWQAASPRYAYQSRKYDALAQMLDRGRKYGRALDLGCGTGLLIERLAPHCDSILGVDISSVAVEHAKIRNSRHANATFRQGDLTEFDTPESQGQFDLIVVADALYYLPATFLVDEELKAFARRFATMLAPGGVLLVANHYFFEFDPASRLTRRIQRAMEWSPWLRPLQMYRRAFYLAGLFERIDGRSLDPDQVSKTGSVL